jgi:hypothetical protein
VTSKYIARVALLLTKTMSGQCDEKPCVALLLTNPGSFPLLCHVLIDYRSVRGTLLDKARGEPVLHKLECTVKISRRHRDANRRVTDKDRLIQELPHPTRGNVILVS